jgi:hypothetical protein
MEMIETAELAEFEEILRKHRMARADFSLSATDTTDPKTDEVAAIQGELTICRNSTGQAKQYLISDCNSWLDLFRSDIQGGAFVGQDTLAVRPPARNAPLSRH